MLTTSPEDFDLDVSTLGTYDVGLVEPDFFFFEKAPTFSLLMTLDIGILCLDCAPFAGSLVLL